MGTYEERKEVTSHVASVAEEVMSHASDIQMALGHLCKISGVEAILTIEFLPECWSVTAKSWPGDVTSCVLLSTWPGPSFFPADVSEVSHCLG